MLKRVTLVHSQIFETTNEINKWLLFSLMPTDIRFTFTKITYFNAYMWSKYNCKSNDLLEAQVTMHQLICIIVKSTVLS